MCASWDNFLGIWTGENCFFLSVRLRELSLWRFLFLVLLAFLIILKGSMALAILEISVRPLIYMACFAVMVNSVNRGELIRELRG